MGGTRFMVQWEEHPSHLATRLGQLLEHQTLVDVTLMCNTHTLRVHRAVLAACSPYFETILQRQLGMHPLIVLKDMQFSVLKSLIEFMYCGETSVTEDNLGALLQAAKFFQVKGLSAMTKEALGLVPSPKSTVNGDAARKAFVGRPKRVGMQQTFVTSGMKTLPASSGGDIVQTVPTKTTFQTVPKPVTVNLPDTLKQTESAQLLLSLSGSEFPKQTFHTVSKNVRIHHNVPGNAVTVEPARTCAVDTSVVKKEVAERVPSIPPNGGVKTATSAAGDMPAIGEDAVASASQSMFVADLPRKRGRPVKRQMNVVFQEKVLTDADMALHKEAEASRKALEMLRQEMLTDPLETNVAGTTGAVTPVPTPALASTSPANVAQVSSSSPDFLRKLPMKQAIPSTSKVASIQTATVTTTSRILNQAAVTEPSKQIAELVAPTDDSNSNDTNVVFKEEPSELHNQAEMPEQVYQLAESNASEDTKENVEYQVAEEHSEQDVDLSSSNTNIVYQMADTTGATSSVMSQYMEVLKEAGLPTDVPILLDSGDGSYVTVNEEVLMNIVNGGVLQCHVTEGNIVSGGGVEFIVQELTEDEVEVAQAAERARDEVAETVPADPIVEDTIEMETRPETTPEAQEMEQSEIKTECEQQDSEYVGLPSLNEKENVPMETDSTVETADVIPKEMEEKIDNVEERDIKQEEQIEGYYTTEGEETMDITESESGTADSGVTMDEPKPDEACRDSDVVPGDQYGETAMEEIPVMKEELKKDEGEERITYTTAECNVNNEFIYQEESLSSDQKEEEEEEEKEEEEEEKEEKVEEEEEEKMEVEKVEEEKEEKVEEEKKEEEEEEEEQQEEEEKKQKEEKSDKLSPEVRKKGNEMSVEQALQEMMGESSDTEIENRASEPSTTASQDEEDTQNTLEERSPEQETEELRLVLSPEEESTKQDKSCSSSLNSFSLALSPDSSEPKTELKAEQCLPDSGNSQSMPEIEENIVVEGPTRLGSPDVAQDVETSEDQEVEQVCADEPSAELSIENGELKADVELNESVTVPQPIMSEEEKEDGVHDEVSPNVKDFLQTTSEADNKEFDENQAGEDDTVISPNKDIPFAVGLVPLKTALEKLQAMPEYHPRKTRSSSTGKESAPDMPAARVKRKASSCDGPDKKLKTSSGDDVDMSDNTTPSSSKYKRWPVIAEDSKGGETLHSMPELLTEPSEG